MTFEEWTKKRQSASMPTTQAGDGINSFEDWTNAYAQGDNTAVKIRGIDTEIQTLETIKAEYDGLEKQVQTLAPSQSVEQSNRMGQIYQQYGNLEDKIEGLKASKWKLEKEQKYKTLSSKDDFAQKSGYVSTKTDGIFKQAFSQYSMGYDDLTYEYINGSDDLRAEILNKGIAFNSDTALDTTTAWKKYDLMRNEERKIYNYLYSTEGKDSADEYLDYLKYALDERSLQKTKENAQAFASAHPVVGSITSVPLNLVSGAGVLDIAFQNLEKNVKEAITGEYAGPINYNSDAMSSSVISSTVRGTVAKNIADKTGVIALDESKHPILSKLLNGKSLGDVYQLGMSMADSATVALLSPVLGSAGTVLLGGSAATQGILDAVANGASDEQALMMGVLSGGFEILFEKYELESLLGSDTRVLRSMLKQAISEGAGESGTSIANTLADIIVMAEKSGWQKNIDAYIESGLSREEAEKQAFLDAAIQIGWDFTGGALSGGIMGGGSSVIQNIDANTQAGKAVTANPGGVAALQQAAKDTASELEGSAQRALERLAGRVSTENATGKGLGSIAAKIRNAVNTQRAGKLYNRTANAITDLNVKDLAARLEQGGFSTKKASAVARATMEIVAGYELDAVQQKLLESVWEDPSYQQALTEIVKDEQSGVNQRRERIGQVLRDHSAEQGAAQAATPAAQEEHFPTFQEEVQRQFDEANGYAEEEQKTYDIDEVFQAVQSALNNGTINKDHFNEIVNALSFAQSDYAEGNITEAEFNGALETAMRQAQRFDGGNSESTYSASATDPLVNVDSETWQQAQRLAQALGRDIVFYNGMKGENGYFKDGTIYVNILAVDPFAQVVSHELTHSLEGTKHYEKLKEFVFTQLAKSGKDIAQVRDAKYKQYKGHSKVLESEGEIDAEIVAEYVQNYLLTNEQAIMDLVATEPNIAKRIWNRVSNLARRMIGKQASRERAKLEQIAGIYAKALRESQGEGANIGTVSVTNRTAGGETRVDELQRSRTQTEDAYREGQISDDEYDAAMDEFDRAEDERLGRSLEKYSFAGEQAKNADLEALEKAKQMRQSGVADDTIRQQTGWFMGRDGKWRWEIDDSEMHYYRAGDALFREMHPEYARHQELMKKFLYGELTSEEESEFRELDAVWGREHQRLNDRVNRGSAQLQNMIQHEALFEAYPQLRGTRVVFEEMEAGTNGRYDRNEGIIYLSKNLRNAGGGTLLHEIQHAIQDAEGFGRGSSVEYWTAKLAADRQREVELADKKYRDLFDSMPEELKNKVRAYNRANLDYDYDEAIAIESELFESEYGELFSAWLDADFERRNLRERYKTADLTEDAITKYRNTAGEIEARNTADRRMMTQEQRKNTPPDLGDENTVFAEGDSGVGYSITEQEVRNIQSIGRKSVNDFTSGDIKKTQRFAQQFWKEMKEKSPFFRAWFGDWRVNDQTPVQVASLRGDARGVQFNEDTGWNIQVSGKVFNETKVHSDSYNKAARPYLACINDIVRKAILLDSFGVDPQKPKSNNSLLMHSMYAVADVGNGAEILKLYVEEMNDPNAENTSKRAYQLQNIEKYQPTGKSSQKSASSISPVATGNIHTVADLVAAVKSKDLSFKPKPASKAVNADGTPKVVYHGTNAEFQVFQSSDGNYWFSESEDYAEAMMVERNGDRIIPAYLNMRNPYIASLPANQFTNPVYEDPIIRKAKAGGYDGVIIENETDNELAYDKFYVVFDPAQIKSATDNIGTFDGNDPDIRYSFSDAQTEEQDRRPLEGSYTTDEVEMQARKKGYPVIHGEQVVPFRTWVQTLDRGNYGLVTGLAAENKLLVSFHNKHDGGTADNVAIPYSDLKPVPGAYQMTKEEFASLMESEPLDPGSEHLSEEEMREIEELFNQAKGNEEKAAAPIDLEKLPRKAQNYLKRVQRKLLNSLCNKLGVPRSAMHEHLQGIVEEITGEYLNSGTVSDEKLGELFDKAYAQGIVTDREFYDQYKHIKDYLRTTAVTLSEQDRSNIADFKDFRDRQFGRMRIVNQGGLPVDTAYDELRSMAPELFPENITHPADQLVHMAEVARSIAISKKTLDEFYGPDKEMYRSWAKNDFNVAVGEVMGDLHALRRFADERAAKAAREAAPATVEEAEEAYKKLKKARRTYERVSAKNLLTQRDEMLVGRLLRHEMELEHLNPETDNVKGITAVYEAKAEYERLCKLIAEYKRHIHGEMRAEADKYLATANNWKDKKTGIAYARETMRRNIYDIVADRALARDINEAYFEPVHDAEAKAVRLKDDFRNKVRDMDLSRKVTKGNLVSEAHAVQLLGEAEDNIRILENTRGRMQHRDGKTLAEWRAVVAKLWDENPNLDEGKIRGAVQQFRQIYDDLFKHMNRVRVENGYEPINYRSGYFPHFQPGASDGILAQFGRALGIDTQVVALPTTITGLTHTFKPGIQWFGNAQERLGFNTAYDAVEGFDKYIEGAASVIFQTRNIQRLRAFATQVRYRTSDEGIKEQVDAVYEDNRLTDEEKQVKIADIYEHGKYALANFVAELDEYTNLLANKKSKYDRTIEALMGRKSYAFLKWWESRVGANMIAGNISSALTNFIPLTQAGAQMDKGALLRGMWKTLASYKIDDGLTGASTFLTNRRGSDPLVQSWSQKVSGKLSFLMEGIDQFVSGSIVRGSYYHNLKRGMSEAEAMHLADIFASGVMADRSKGSMPTLMQASNPLFKMFTQFQLEVNNQFSEVFKDLPRNHRDKGVLRFALVLFQYFLGAWAFNELYERLMGRRSALDPIGILLDAGKDFADPDVGFGEGVQNLTSNVLSELPFSSGLTLIGFETDGGRIPASSAVPDLSAVWDAATEKGWSAERRWKELQDELNKLSYVVPPFGGNQVSKIWKGTKAFIEGGSYSVDAGGDDILQYPVYKDDPWSALGALFRATLLGKSSLPEAQEWVSSGFNGLNAKETAIYADMLGVGVSQKDAFALMQDMGAAKKTEELSKEAVQRNILRESDVPGEGKAIVYYGLLANDKERGLMDTLAEMDADAGEVMQTLMRIRDAGSLEGAEETKAKYDAIIQALLTDEEKAVLVGSITGTEMLTDTGKMTQYAKFKAAVEGGMSVDEYLEFRKAGGDIDDYLGFANAGLDPDDAADISLALDELVPLDGKEQVSKIQQWRTCVDTFSNEATQLAALAAKMDDSQRTKLNVAYEYSVSPDTYVTLKETLPKFDFDGSGGLNQEEVTQAVNSIKGLTSTQRAVLWQISVTSKSAKNNPFSVKVGEQVLDALGKG